MEAFLTKTLKATAFGTILCLGISLGVGFTSQSGFQDHYGMLGFAITAFLAGAYVALSTVRAKLHQETL